MDEMSIRTLARITTAISARNKVNLVTQSAKTLRVTKGAQLKPPIVVRRTQV
jgi:hypothetical protein